MTIDEAILESLAVKNRQHASRLRIATQMRFKRKNRAEEPSERVVKAAIAKLVTAGKLVALPGDRYELSAAAAKTVKKPVRKKATPLPKGRVYFFSPHEDGFERAQKAVKKRFTVKGDSFRWNGGPALRLEASTRADAVRGAYPFHRRWLSKQEMQSVFCLAFDDVNAVLDEINTLIEAQVLISKVADAPRFLAWNKTLMSVDDEVVKFTFR